MKMWKKSLYTCVVAGITVVGTLLPGLLSPQLTFANAPVTVDYQVSVNGTKWFDVGVGNLQGPQVITGETVYARVIVTNNGSSQLNNVQVTDPTVNPSEFTFRGSSSVSLPAGQNITSDLATMTAVAGHQFETATVTGVVSGSTTPVTANDSIDYNGVMGSVSIDAQISVNGGTTWADIGNGSLQDPVTNFSSTVGGNVEERVLVTNTGDLSINNAEVTNVNGPANFTFGGNLTTMLAPGASIISDVATISADAGHQINTATVSGQVTDGTNTKTVTASDQADYTGQVPATLSGTLGPGQTIGSTEVTVPSLATGDTLAYTIGTSSQPEPALNSILSGAATSYTSGADILNVKSGQYLDVYEVNGSNHIQAWQQYVLQNADIDSISLITISPSFASVMSGQSETVTGAVYDTHHNPVIGTTVDLSDSSGSWQSSSETTNSSGDFTAKWTAPTTYITTNPTVTASVYGTNPAVQAQATIQVQAASTSAPTALQHTNVTQTGWTESWGNVTGASSYDVYLNNQKVGTVTQAVYDFTGEQPNTTYSVTIASVNGNGQMSAQSQPDSVTTTRLIFPLSVGTNWLENGQYGISYQPVQLDVNSGQGPYTWSLTNGSLPSGLTLSSTGVISGTPNGPNETSTFTVKVTDADGQTATRTLFILVSGAPELSITTPALPRGTVGASYLFQMGASGGNPITWSIISGNLPSGLSMDASGLLSGIPTESGTFTFTTQVSNGSANQASQSVTLKVNALGAGQRIISLNGHSEVVPAFVRNHTTDMPIWYVMQMLKTMNINSKWDGHNWYLTTANQPTLRTVSRGTGSMHLYVNGTLVKNLTGFYAKDPHTGVMTTYMPIWYVMQVLKTLNISSSWNGTTWTLTNNTAQSGKTSSAN